MPTYRSFCHISTISFKFLEINSLVIWSSCEVSIFSKFLRRELAGAAGRKSEPVDIAGLAQLRGFCRSCPSKLRGSTSRVLFIRTLAADTPVLRRGIEPLQNSFVANLPDIHWPERNHFIEPSTSVGSVNGSLSEFPRKGSGSTGLRSLSPG